MGLFQTKLQTLRAALVREAERYTRVERRTQPFRVVRLLNQRQRRRNARRVGRR